MQSVQTCIPLFTKDLHKAFLKGALLPCKRAPFAVSKPTRYFHVMNLYYTTSYTLFLFLISEYHTLCIIRTTQ